MKSKNGILSGAFVLLLANIIVKITGMIYKIPLQRLLTDVGMGYFNAAYNIYAWFYLVSTAGLPVAVSISVAKALAENRREKAAAVFRLSFAVFSGAGALFTFVMIALCRSLSSAASIDNAYLCIAAVAPSVFISCLTASVRGYYQGHGVMWVTAVSQIIEAVGKLTFGLLFAGLSAGRGDEFFVSAAWSVFGITCGSFLSALFCLTVKSFYIRYPGAKPVYKGVLREIMKTAVPVTVSASVMNLVSLSDVFLAPSLLMSNGYSQVQAAGIYGNYSTVCTSLINLPMVFVHPVCSSSLPALSAALSRKDEASAAKCVRFAYSAVSALIFPCAVGLGVMSYQVSALIFPDTSAALAAPMLTALSPSLIFCALISVTDVFLQSAGLSNRIVISMLSGSAAKLVSTVLLFRFTAAGRLAIPLGTCICYLVAASVNLAFLRQRAIFKPDASALIRPALCAVICGITAAASYKLLISRVSDDPAAIISVMLSAAVYFAALVCTGFFAGSGLGSELKNLLRNRENDTIRKKREVQF